MALFKVFGSAFVGLGCLMAMPAQAVVITQLTDFSDFTSPTIFTQDFETTPFDTSQLTFDPTVVQVSAAAATGGVTSSGSFLATETEDDEPLTVLFSEDVFEVGMIFGDDDFFLIFDAILEVFDGSNALLGTVTVSSNANHFADQFIGLRSDTAIRRADVRYQRPDAFTNQVTIDDFTIGTNGSDSVSVSEPATLSLLALSGIALGAIVRRRRKVG